MGSSYRQRQRFTQHSRRKFLRYTGAAGAVALAGCNSGGSPGNSVSSGGGDILTGETIKLGVLGPYEDGNIGQAMQKGAEMAVDHYQNGGLNIDGPLGADVEILFRETQFSAGATRNAHRDLAVQNRVDATFGPLRPDAHLAMMESIAQTETINIVPSGLDDQVITAMQDEYEKYKYNFAIGTTPEMIEKSAHTFVNDYGSQWWDKAGVFYGVPDEEIYDLSKITAFDFEFVETIPPGTSDFAPYWDQAENHDVDVAFTWVFGNDIPAVKQWHDQKRQFELAGFFLHMNFNDFMGVTDGTGEYVTGLVATPYTANTTELTQPFFKEFNERYGYKPTAQGPMVYDAVATYLQAVTEIETTDTEEVVDYMASDLKREPAVWTKKASFYDKNSKTPHNLVWDSVEEDRSPAYAQWQTKDGESRPEVLMPGGDYATGEHITPHWIN